MEKSWYLKYRPTTLSDVIGQNHITDILQKAFATNNLVHAYILSGHHGCGKTSLARIIANLLTCKNAKNGTVCGKCPACTKIPLGTSLDIKELDGASNRGIDHIKSIIESAQWSPQELPKKVFIIDEAHQLSKEAASALLKTLEEPPSHSAFILCTTDIDKILPTILSRCQRFNCNKLSSTDISSRLGYITSKEGIDIDKDSLITIAKMGKGSMRDSIGYLEQVCTANKSQKITIEMLTKYYGSASKSGIISIVKSIVAGDISGVLEQINDMITSSIDSRKILYELSEVFRNMMIIKHTDSPKLLDMLDYEIEMLKKIGEPLTANQLLKMAYVFSEIDKKISFNINERWIMEATLINCISIAMKKTS